ncbi:hypothetical protein vBKpnAMK4_00502 [Klebsiella phage vB_Kpn_AM_K4]
MKALQAHLMHESGKDFQEIARALDITPAEAAKLWVSVEKAHERFKQKEKVVYRKRLTNVGYKSITKALQAHLMHESGKDFQEIARALDITPAEAAKLWVSVEKAHERFKQKEKVVYRKRLTNVETCAPLVGFNPPMKLLSRTPPATDASATPSPKKNSVFPSTVSRI